MEQITYLEAKQRADFGDKRNHFKIPELLFISFPTGHPGSL
jgi:hypothetical protein